MATGRALTPAEKTERMQFVLDLLRDCRYKWEIKRALKEKYGIRQRAANSLISAAQRILLKELRVDPEVHAADAMNFLKAVIKDPAAKTSDRLTAQKQLNSLLGLDRPVKVALADVTPVLAAQRQELLKDDEEIKQLRAEAITGNGDTGTVRPDSEQRPVEDVPAPCPDRRCPSQASERDAPQADNPSSAETWEERDLEQILSLLGSGDVPGS